MGAAGGSYLCGPSAPAAAGTRDGAGGLAREQIRERGEAEGDHEQDSDDHDHRPDRDRRRLRGSPGCDAVRHRGGLDGIVLLLST